jgi:L,D-transpeptidase ErfK/SrfK
MYLAWPQYLIHGTNKPAGVGLRSSHGCIRLYPEDIEFIYEMVPVGEKVTVVNQPFVFGWHHDQLYLQTFEVLEDDPRDWQKAQKKLVSRNLAQRIQKQLAERKEAINWEAVSQLAHDPRGLPVSISKPGASFEQTIAAAVRVQNKVPVGATWDGKSNLPMDETTFRQMVSDSDPEAPATSPSRATPARVTPPRT